MNVNDAAGIRAALANVKRPHSPIGDGESEDGEPPVGASVWFGSPHKDREREQKSSDCKKRNLNRQRLRPLTISTAEIL